MPVFRFALLIALMSCGVAAQTQWDFTVVDRKPQTRDNFVQGLEIVGDKLYLSSGMYGQSRLRRYDFDSGELELERPLDPRLFAEGVTVLNDRVYQLTWRARLGLVYQREALEPLELFRLPGEGWGITHNGKELIYSDGSNLLRVVNPGDYSLARTVEVTESGRPVSLLNELEWINGEVWANVWQSDRIVTINPATGNVTGSIDLSGLLPAEEYGEGTDVLNGIAFDRRDGGIWVTGKRWPYLYRIELKPTSTPPPLLTRPHS